MAYFYHYPMKLIPVVEFAPTYYQTKHHEMPDCSGQNCFDEWDTYWKNSLADSGIIGLEPYEKGSWLVETERLLDYNKALEHMLRNHMLYVDLDKVGNVFEHVSALPGGYILEITETIQVYPQCCGSLKDISEWKRASEYVDREEATLWIGHPSLMVSAIDQEHLRIRKTAEYHEPAEPVILELKRSDLKTAILDAEKKLSRFQQVLLPILRKIMPENAEEGLKVLING
jgi:hypothetical protein